MRTSSEMAKELLSMQQTPPKVAITFYSKRTSDKSGYYTGIFSDENKNEVMRLKEGIEKAAMRRGDTPPKIEITLFLIPNWEKHEDYNSPEYLAAKQQMFVDAKAFYGKDIIIKDFLETCVTEAELGFIRDCQSLGSIADIVKTRTIIDSAGTPCLQTDCNVTWANNNFEKLYELTFASNMDAFNASRCSEIYVSAHNKMVFTGSDSKLPSIFSKTLVDYCTQYQNDQWHKSESCNGVYDIAFGEGMCQHGLTYRVRVDDKYNPGKTFDFFPANLEDSRYKLMPLVVACQRESWRKGMPPPDPVVVELTGNLTLPDHSKKPALEVDIGGVRYGYYHFKSLVRVFTNVPSWHTEEGKYKYATATHDYFEGAEKARNLFVSQQDTELCMTIFAEYYNAVKLACEQGNLQQGPRTLQVLADLIPETEAGNKLTQVLFQCSAKELHSNPIRAAVLPETVKHDKMCFNVQASPTFWKKKQEIETQSTTPQHEKDEQFTNKPQ